MTVIHPHVIHDIEDIEEDTWNMSTKMCNDMLAYIYIKCLKNGNNLAKCFQKHANHV